MAAVEVKVVDEDGQPAEVGELLCSGPAIMDGYHKDPDLTRSTIVDGWLHTGDIVRIDEDANIFFFDRKKDVIKTGGMNVSSLEVENVLLSCAGVTDAHDKESGWGRANPISNMAPAHSSCAPWGAGT